MTIHPAHPNDAHQHDAPARVSTSGPQALSRYLLAHQLASPYRIEALLGCKLSQLDDPDCRIDLLHYQALWAEAIEASGDLALGLHIGELVDPEHMGLVGLVFFNCDTLRHAMSQYVRLSRLLNEAIDIHLDVQGDQAVLCWQCARASDYCQPDMERTLAAAVVRARHFIHPRLRINELALAHPQPAWIKEYQRIFDCPLRFNAIATSLSFDAHYLDWPLPKRNPHVYEALLGHVNRLLARVQPLRSFSKRVRKLIAQQLGTGQVVDADHLAAQLHMSRQTLYRKLKREDHQFHELVEEVRQRKALRYLAQGKLTLSEIAFLLGFSELSAFSRAFKRWHGQSPAHYLHTNHAHDPHTDDAPHAND